MKSDIETVKEKIAQEILGKSADTEIDDVLSTSKYEDLKSHLMIRAINFLRNSVRLEDAIYSRFGDMVKCAYLKVSDKNGQFMSVKVKNDMLEKYNVSAEQVINDAVNNSCVLYPERLFFSLNDLCRSMHRFFGGRGAGTRKKRRTDNK